MCVKTSVPSSSQFAFVDQTSPKKKELSIPALDKQIVPHVQSSSNEPDIISPPPFFLLSISVVLHFYVHIIIQLTIIFSIFLPSP